MVSVVVAIWLPHAFRAAAPPPIASPPGNLRSKPRANLSNARLQGNLTRLWLRYCMAHGTGADVNEVDDVPSVSEPHGLDRAMADGGCRRTEISQSGAAGRLRQGVRKAGRSPRADLAHFPHLHAAGLRHRQGASRQPGTQGHRGGHLRDAVRLALAFQEGEFAGAAEATAGGAD